MMKSKIGTLIMFVFVFLLLCFPLYSAVTVDEFVSKFRLKFRRTPTIYLEAVSYPLEDRGETVAVTIGYRYPEEVFQWVRGRSGGEQIFILSGDSVVISYPHLDIQRREKLTEHQKWQALLENLPFAALVAGLESNKIPEENIDIKPN